jgi:tetratricopeptide (TPR) repeat protein
VALQTLYEETGDLDALDEAIEIFQQAVGRTSPGHANWFKYQHNLTSALMRLAERSGDLSGIDEAIRTWQDVVDGTPDSHPSKPGRLSALATTRFMRFQRDLDDLSPLDAGIENLRDALRLSPPGHSQRAMLLTNLGALLLSRFEQTGDRDVLNEAVCVSRDATTAATPRHADRGRHLSNLGVALVQLTKISDKPRDSGNAIDIIRQALEVVGPGDPGRADTLIAMGAACARAFELGDEEALAPGLAALREAADMEIASPAARIRAGRDGGHLAAAGSATGEALEAFAAAVRLIEEAAWAGMRRADQQRLLGELDGLPMDAAAMAIEADHPEEALELLEQGRAVLVTRRLEAPGLQAELKALAPEIAEELAAVQAALGEAEQDRGLAAPGRDLAAHRSRLARRRTAILDRLRADPSLQGIVGGPSLGKLLKAGSRGPVVVVNVSEYRCDALVLSAGRVRTVPFRGLTRRAVAEQVQKLLEAVDAMRTREVDEVLAWAWNLIVEPIFAALKLTEPPAAGQETHLWWCATGLAAFLPLHAAGTYGSGTQTRYCALDLVVSSYTPSLRTLIQLRQRQPAHEAGRPGPLIVAMPKTPGLQDLESAAEEAADIARRSPAHELLTGPSATRDAVSQAMPHHPWAHYACHGSQDPRDPFRSALHLYDGPLSITQITSLQLPNPVLAYVSACDTSRGGTSIPDESITLASALQIAGYQHVIAALWQIIGFTATEIAKHLYDQVVTVRDGNIEIDGNAVAGALRAATIRLREESQGMSAMY